LQYNLILI